MEETVLKAAQLFSFCGNIDFIEVKKDGNINSTYIVHCGKHKYILQKLNTYVFKKPEEVMSNIQRVTSFLIEKLTKKYGSYENRVLELIPTKTGAPYINDEELGFWRAYCFIENTTAYNIIENPQHFYEAGRIFGQFQGLLSDFPADTLYETIPNFHNTVARLQDFENAVAADRSGRAKFAQKEIELILSRKEEASRIMDMLGSPELPRRVTHNDTKLNNVMIDNITGKAMCVIDLDTVMPGTSLYDYGDAVRYGANRVSEEERDLSLVGFDLNLFDLFTKGFIHSTNGYLTPTEISLMPTGVKLIALELASRFLADYIDGDLYFHTSYAENNLNRARVQLLLMQDVEAKMTQLEDMVQKYI